MPDVKKSSDGLTLTVLHPAFALTGVLHAMGGPLLPSLAATFHLNDSQSGALLALYFGGTSVGALMCVGRYARLMSVGFVAVALACLGVFAAPGSMMQVLFLLLGICVGVPMSAVSIYAGHRFAERSAAPLTFLNFSWSLGALIAPLLAARMLVNHTFRSTYLVLAIAAAVAALGCWVVLDDPRQEKYSEAVTSRGRNLRLVVLFAFLSFLEVGIENTSVTWLATFAMRSAGTGAAVAAATSSLYWWGFLASRALSSLVLLRADAMRVLRIAVITGLFSSLLLVGVQGFTARAIAMLILGAALGPVFPLLLARFFASTRRSSDSRWVLSICGFGGSVVPWLTGSISTHTGSLRLGLLIVPAALLLMIALMPLLRTRDAALRA